MRLVVFLEGGIVGFDVVENILVESAGEEVFGLQGELLFDLRGLIDFPSTGLLGGHLEFDELLGEFAAVGAGDFGADAFGEGGYEVLEIGSCQGLGTDFEDDGSGATVAVEGVPAGWGLDAGD